MGMADLHSATTQAAATVLREVGASAPNTDTDTLAGLIATAVIQAAKEHAATTADPAEELAKADTPTDTASINVSTSTEGGSGNESNSASTAAEAGHDVADGKPDTEPATPA